MDQGKTNENSPVIHNQDLIIEHEGNFEKINKRLKEGDKILKWLVDEFKLMNDAWGIKTRKNGDRDRKLKEIERRTDKGLEKAEDEDKNIRDLVISTREEVKELKGYLSGSNEVKKDKTEWNRRKLIAYIGLAGAFIVSMVINVILLFLH